MFQTPVQETPSCPPVQCVELLWPVIATLLKHAPGHPTHVQLIPCNLVELCVETLPGHVMWQKPAMELPTLAPLTPFSLHQPCVELQLEEVSVTWPKTVPATLLLVQLMQSRLPAPCAER